MRGEWNLRDWEYEYYSRILRTKIEYAYQHKQNRQSRLSLDQESQHQDRNGNSDEQNINYMVHLSAPLFAEMIVQTQRIPKSIDVIASQVSLK